MININYYNEDTGVDYTVNINYTTYNQDRLIGLDPLDSEEGLTEVDYKVKYVAPCIHEEFIQQAFESWLEDEDTMDMIEMACIEHYQEGK